MTVSADALLDLQVVRCVSGGQYRWHVVARYDGEVYRLRESFLTREEAVERMERETREVLNVLGVDPAFVLKVDR